MSGMTFVIQDADQIIHTSAPSALAEQLVVGLCDDPETVAELAQAMNRLKGSALSMNPLGNWSASPPPELPRQNIMWVDLRTADVLFVAGQRELPLSGQLELHDPESGGERRYYYSLPPRWTVYQSCREWLDDDRQAAERFVSRADYRAVLYDKVCRFLIRQCAEASGGRVSEGNRWQPPPQWQWQVLHGRGKTPHRITTEDAIAEIHARWLMTPREDLDGRTPRQILTADRDAIARQVHMREMEWSANREPPEPLSPNSAAYRTGGIGPHEGIVYYDLVRHLARQCWVLVVERNRIRSPRDKARIEQVLLRVRDRWLATPCDDHDSMRPVDVIESERRRLPLNSDTHSHEDDDCPLCQLAAEVGPGFWHLDGSHMDPEYAFSLDDLSYSDWEEEQAEWEAYCDRYDDDRAEARMEYDSSWTDASTELGSVFLDDAESEEEEDEIWFLSASYGDPFQMPFTAMFVIGAHVAEISQVLQELDNRSDWPSELNRHYANLRDAIRGESSMLLSPVAEKFAELLDEIGGRHEELRRRCDALIEELRECVERFSVTG